MSFQRPIVLADDPARQPYAGPYPAPLPDPDPGKPRRWNTGCGTDPGWHTHRRRGEDPCTPCETAHTEALKAWAQAREKAATLAELTGED